MDALSRLIRETLPNYLKGLPVPNTISGFASLSGGDWLHLLPFVGGVSLLVYSVVKAVLPPPPRRESVVNTNIQKESNKVVNAVDIEDIGEKGVYCRCWRSKKFPFCDGSHNAHNEKTGDNVGPLIVKRKQ